MAAGQQSCGPHSVTLCKCMIAFISLSCYLIMHQLDFISRHFAVAFNIPTHNIGIYFNKLYSLRSLMFFFSGLIENCMFQGAGGDRDPVTSTMVRRYFGISITIAMFAVRCVYLFLLYSSSQLAYHIYIMMVVEGIVFGFNEAVFMTLGSEYMSIISPFYNVSRMFVSGVQFILDRIWYRHPLLMIKMQAWIAVIFTGIAAGLWYYYNIHIKMESPTPQEVLEFVKQPAKSVFDLLVEKLTDQDTLREKHEEIQKIIKELEEKIEKGKQPVSGSPTSESSSQTQQNGTTSQVTQTNESSESEILKYCNERVGKDGFGAALSPLLLYWASTMFKDFLFPATLPYGLLHRDKCHVINIMIPIFMNFGPLTFFFIDNFTPYFSCWSWYFDLFWALFIPLPILLTFVLRAMLTQDRRARRIINSRPRVTSMTFMLMVSFGYMEPLSYMGLGKYAFRENPGGYSLMGFHVNSAMLCRAIFSRISVGFSDTRISLGYHLPKFRPNHRMSRKNLHMYLVRQTFRRAWKDAKGDFKLDIKKYL